MKRSRLSAAVLCAAALILVACGQSLAGGAPTAVPAPTAAPPTAVPAATAAPQPTAVPAPTAVPTAAAPQPTPPPPAVRSPEDTVRAFLERFAGGGDGAIDPASFLSQQLRGQIRPDYPLNYLMGMQNMYSGFEIERSEGGPDRVSVHALLTFMQPLPYTFELIMEQGQWRIDRIVLPDTGGKPTALPGSDDGAGIYFIAPDGVSVFRVMPEGGAPQLAYSDQSHLLGGPLTYLGPVPGNPYQMLVLGSDRHYIVGSGGVATDLGNFATPPRWSADGWRAVGATPTDTGTPGAITIFDMREKSRAELPVSGTPDWFPDGQRLVYVACGPEPDEKGCNVWAYDLANGTSTRITELVSTESDRWYVQEAHVLPDNNTVIFYGNHTTEVGASGNGLQWWAIPAGGGEMKLYSQNYGNGVNDFQLDPRAGLLAYSTRAHSSACASVGGITVRDSSAGGDPAGGNHPALPGADEARDSYASVKGLSWDPSGSGRLAFGSQAYTCTDQNRELQPAAVYVWDARQPGAVPRKLADGSFPVWIGAGL